MKPLTYSLLAAALACGLASATTTTAYTTPVGYETLTVHTGVNFLGLRLQQPTVAAGLIAGVTSTTITVGGSLDLGTVLAPGTTYILEVNNANGVTQEFLSSAASGSVITTSPVNLTSTVAVNDSYKIRTAPTLASTFGLNNSAGLDTGFFGLGGDIVLLPNPSTPGGFDQYYYDAGQTSWADVNGNPVNGANIAWNYADGVVISATGAGLSSTNPLTVSGEVKKGNTGYNLTPNAINFLSSVSPVGANLVSCFNASLGSIDQGFFGLGGDIFYVPNTLTPGGFDQYYYDGGQSSWADVNGNPVDGSTINLASGLIIFNSGPAADIVNNAPAFYSSL